MRFKEWLEKIDESAPRTQNAPSPFTAAANAASRFGSGATQLAISADLDNATVAGLAGGVGSAINRNLQRMGHNIAQTPRIEPFPRDKKPLIEHGSLPLQLPIIDGRPVLGQSFTYGKAGVRSLRGLVSDRSYEDGKIRKVGEDLDEIAPPGKFELYQRIENREDAIRSYQTAVNFTQALIHVIIRDKMQNVDKLKNKYDVDSMKLESTQTNENNTITCVFSFKPNATMVDKDDGGEI
jgi:hypothetical protein